MGEASKETTSLMVFYVYSSDFEMESGADFMHSLSACQDRLDDFSQKHGQHASARGAADSTSRGGTAATLPKRNKRKVPRTRKRRPRTAGAMRLASDERARPDSGVYGRAHAHAQAHGGPDVTFDAQDQDHCHMPAATRYEELSFSERRLGNEAIKAILDRGRTHNGLIKRASASVDTSEPRTRAINRWHAALRSRDPMPELELPKDVKLHSSWTQLSELKWRKDWHERLLTGTKSNLDMTLPKHVTLYQRRKKEELHKLLHGSAPKHLQ